MSRPFINNRLHLAVQHKVKELIDAPDVYLEYSFKGHIADVYWESKNTVFEIQCSPMPLKEIKKRTNDYEKLGIHLVWILHQKTFNKNSLSPAENYIIQNKRFYYTDISQHGEGIVFTQEEVILYERRLFKSYPLPIDLSQPMGSAIFFKNDLTDMGLIKRIRTFPEIWKEKARALFLYWKRTLTYYFAYIKWKTTL